MKFILGLWLAFLGPLASVSCFADPVAVPTDLNGVAGLIPTFLAAWQNKNWLLIGALVSLVLTFIIKTYVLPKIGIGNASLPWISIVIGILAGVGGAVAGGAPLGAAALAIFSGPLASSLWAMLFQFLVPKAPVA